MEADVLKKRAKRVNLLVGRSRHQPRIPLPDDPRARSARQLNCFSPMRASSPRHSDQGHHLLARRTARLVAPSYGVYPSGQKEKWITDKEIVDSKSATRTAPLPSTLCSAPPAQPTPSRILLEACPLDPGGLRGGGGEQDPCPCRLGPVRRTPRWANWTEFCICLMGWANGHRAVRRQIACGWFCWGRIWFRMSTGFARLIASHVPAHLRL